MTLLLTCELCGEKIPDAEFKKHKVRHQLGELPEETINPVTGLPDGIKPEIPQPQQATVVPVKVPEIKKTTNEPIVLRYLFTGTCPTCQQPVKTIELEGIPEKDKTTVVAYCISEDKNIQQRIVTRI